jgi:hypothetical protein
VLVGIRTSETLDFDSASTLSAEPRSRLEQRVAELGQSAGSRAQGFDGALIGGEPTTGCLIDRDGEGGLVSLAARVGQDGVTPVGPVGQQRQRSGVGAQRGRVVLGEPSDSDRSTDS